MNNTFFGFLKRLFSSIAFVPALIAMGFGMLPFLLITFPLPDLKGTPFAALSITDTKHVGTILSFVIGGVFTLTIFSYTMVMSVLNRSINNYSPRLIPLLLSEKDHQIILGVTSGTLIYALILTVFTTSDAALQFPQIGAGLAILFTMACVILFIYFVHSVSRSIHINYILRKSYLSTKRNIKGILHHGQHLVFAEVKPAQTPHYITNAGCGYFNGLRIERLARLAEKHDFTVEILALRGDFILEDQKYLAISREVNDVVQKKIRGCFNIDHDEPLKVTEVGFKHLVEVAIKASSPSINDPGTSVSCLDYLTQLFGHYLQVAKFNAYAHNGKPRIFIKRIGIDVLFDYCFAEMYRYMKDDPVLMVKLKASIEKIQALDSENRLVKAIRIFKKTTRFTVKTT